MFLVCLDGVAHSPNGILVDILSARLWHDVATRFLQEATILSLNFLHSIACHLQERVRSVDDGVVWLCKVADNESDRAVDGTQIDLSIWPAIDSEQHGHHVQATWAIKAGVYEGIGGVVRVF